MSDSAQFSGNLRPETYGDMPVTRSQTEVPQQRTERSPRGRGRGRAQPPPLHISPVLGFSGLQ